MTANAALIELAFTELRRGLREALIENAYPHFNKASAALREVVGKEQADDIDRQVMDEVAGPVDDDQEGGAA